MRGIILYIIIITILFSSCTTTRSIPSENISVSINETETKNEESESIKEFHIGVAGGSLMTILISRIFK